MGPAVCLRLLLFARIRQELREERKEETRARLGKAERSQTDGQNMTRQEARGADNERTASGEGERRHLRRAISFRCYSEAEEF